MMMLDQLLMCHRCIIQALLQAKWPLELEDNESFCTKVYAGNRGLVPAQLSSVCPHFLLATSWSQSRPWRSFWPECVSM